jgi:hypothetical protein
MTDDEYIRSRRYGLLYVHNVKGLHLRFIPSFFSNDVGKSVVIASRGNSINFKDKDFNQPTVDIKNSVSGDGGYLGGEVDSLKMYFWIRSSTISQVKNFLRKNNEHRDWIKYRFKILNKETCKCLMLLLDLTGVKNDSIADVDWLTFAKLKTGGVELIPEFLLGSFIDEWEAVDDEDNFEPNGKDYRMLRYGDDSDLASFFCEPLSSEQIVVGECAPLFKLEMLSDLMHLTKYRYVSDSYDGQSWETAEGSYVYFNVDIKNKKKLDDELLIPKRIYEILDESQIEHLKKTAASVITDNLEYVYKSILKQQIPQVESFKLNSQHNAWGTDMYSLLGGDGYEDVYLGDGMSIDANGRIVDD